MGTCSRTAEVGEPVRRVRGRRRGTRRASRTGRGGWWRTRRCSPGSTTLPGRRRSPTWCSRPPAGTAYPPRARTPRLRTACSTTTAPSGRRSSSAPPRPTRSAGWRRWCRRSRRLADGEPIALLEVGASAGLCLYPDRWRYEWRRRTAALRRAGAGRCCAATSPARRRCPDRPPRWPGAAAIDLHPLDVTDRTRWTGWPRWSGPSTTAGAPRCAGRRDRPRRPAADRGRGSLRRAPARRRAGARATAGRGVPQCRDRLPRRRTTRAVPRPDDRAGRATARCHWVSNEGEGGAARGVTAGPLPAPSGQRAERFALGVDGRAVAWTHGHGRSMTWR